MLLCQLLHAGAMVWNHGVDFNAESDMGFNGTEMPGAVFWPRWLHAQKGCQLFQYTGEMQDPDDSTIPNDGSEKMLRYVSSCGSRSDEREKLSFLW